MEMDFLFVISGLLYLVLIALTVLAVAYFSWIQLRTIRVERLLGNKKCHLFKYYPLLGFLPVLLKVKDCKEFYEQIVKLALKTNQELANIFILHKNWVCIGSPAIIEKLVMSPDAMDKPVEYDVFGTVSQGVFVANKDKWKKLRKALNKTFTTIQLESYLDVNTELSKICNRLCGETDGYVNVLRFVHKYFVDLILRTHFGLNSNVQEDDKYKLFEALEVLFDIAFRIRIANPLLLYEPFFRLTKHYPVVLKYEKFLYKPIEEVAKIRYPAWLERKEKNNGNPVNENMMDHYFEAVNELGMKQNLDTYNKLACDIIIAGSDTTSYATCTLIYFIALKKDIQEKVYEEVMDNWPVHGDLTREDLGKMEYLEMCIREALRLSCPPGVIRYLTRDIVVDSDCVIPKGSNAYLGMEHLHHNPQYWEKPKDFYPEHFLPEAVAARPKMSYMPFSGGPRICPGGNYAMQAMKCLVAYIIRDHKLDTNLPYDQVEIQVHFMKEFVQGYPIKFTRRQPHN